MGTVKRQFVIIGAGTGGITVCAMIARRMGGDKIAIIEPSEKHYYQPLWTLVSGGIVEREKSVRDQADYIPDNVEWVKDRVTEFFPDDNYVMTAGGTRVEYDYLIVAPGLQINWNLVEGLSETLGKNGVCSNYAFESVNYTWELEKNFKGGRAIFTMPSTPVKCAGAPQKVMYLAEEYFRMSGVRDKSEVMFVSAGGAIFGVPKYREALEKVVDSRDIKTLFKHDLVKVDGPNKKATFKNLDTGELVTMDYDMLHVTPPMGPPDFIKNSPIAAKEGGWAEADKYTLQHPRFKNIFCLGDASSLPTSRTGAAIRSQAPVAFDNLMRVVDGLEPTAKYDGYASCPLITSRSRCILAEFGYDGEVMETFPFNQAKERWSMYQLKRHFIPFMYWNFLLKGYT
ncbi:MAG: NAD(P)/FAD-dependent oxidoreductase [Pseudobdellovibrionaceae bacterium]|nr:NAD(P)/FAD-dependent oxidoreductase [Bdellovibrionales bacterium]USN48130.1 MAG: NAD(P)/FAD-dependent oxidoreductase [Pseudobdellovibrionaceae bacterium]